MPPPCVKNSWTPTDTAIDVELLTDLEARGLIQDTTDRAALAARLAAGPVTAYVGLDPTADSLHVGHLVGQLLLRRLQLAGHKPIALAGGATGMIGDPGGRSDERNLLDAETLDHNVACITAQLGKFIDFEPGPYQARLVNNYDWTAPVSILNFLRDVGKHFTINQMVARDSVKNRMEGERGISYTEFSYMLLQAFDYKHLYDTVGCELQMGGSEQWGNIVSGVDLIRRTSGGHAHALVHPLITRSDGVKMGKSADGALWLDPAQTSPYKFQQWFMNLPDADVLPFLMRLTLLPIDEILAINEAHLEAPHLREGQRALGCAVTTIVHGAAASTNASAAAEVLFGADPRSASLDALGTVAGEIPCAEAHPGDELLALVARSVCTSNGDARRTLAAGGITINGSKRSETAFLTDEDFLFGTFAILRKGKSNYWMVKNSS